MLGHAQAAEIEDLICLQILGMLGLFWACKYYGVKLVHLMLLCQANMETVSPGIWTCQCDVFDSGSAYMTYVECFYN